MGDRRIGERLIEKGLITEEQLETALKAQLIVGGHLGTCMIELGLVDEASLGGALSESYGVPYAPAEALEDIPEATIRVVPRKIAEEHRVVPFRVQQKSLHLAMVNPSSLHVLDTLSFATSMRIVPWVAPEIRIFQALERYYGVPRRVRYIGICESLDSPASRSHGSTGATTAAVMDGNLGGRSEGGAAESEHGEAASASGLAADTDRELGDSDL